MTHPVISADGHIDLPCLRRVQEREHYVPWLASHITCFQMWMGVDNVIWGSDFPHPNSLWPDSQEFLDRMLAALPDETRRRLTYDTAAEVYGFPRRET